MSEQHKPTPYAQGRTLSTAQTDHWSKDELARNDAIESMMIFSGFSSLDAGRSRRLVARCEDQKDAAFIVQACNAHDSLVAALREARNEITHPIKGPDGGLLTLQIIEQIDAALALADPQTMEKQS